MTCLQWPINMWSSGVWPTYEWPACDVIEEVPFEGNLCTVSLITNFNNYRVLINTDLISRFSGSANLRTYTTLNIDLINNNEYIIDFKNKDSSSLSLINNDTLDLNLINTSRSSLNLDSITEGQDQSETSYSGPEYLFEQTIPDISLAFNTRLNNRITLSANLINTGDFEIRLVNNIIEQTCLCEDCENG